MEDYAHTPGSNYADPGFQKDGKKRYPLDTPEKTKAAWSYINMKRNSSKYSPEQLSHIKNKIKAAHKTHGLPFKDKTTSSIHSAEFSSVTPKLMPPDSTVAHFFTSGRLITYNEPNKNGMVFFKSDCHPVIGTLEHSLADVAHVKPGNGTPAINGENNASIGSIYEVHEDDEGIDIICKNDRDATQGLGFSEEDFKPIDGIYSCFSQESEFTTASSPIIAVRPGVLHNIDSDKDIVYEIHPDDARVKGLSTSYFDTSRGKWVYNTDPEGNTLFIRLRPLSFSGVGHVISPADDNAMIYTYAACIEDGEKVISRLYPRKSLSDIYPNMDDPGYLPATPEDVSSGGGNTFDQGYATDDFRHHPDLSSASKDFHGDDGDDDDEHPDDHYAASYYDYSPHDPTQPDVSQTGNVKKRAFRIKDKNGNFDRNRLIAAYHAVTGMRGATHMKEKLPRIVASHALAVIRQGLDQTKPKEKIMSEIINTPAIEQDIATLEERAKVLSAEKATATAAYQTLIAEFNEYKETQVALSDTKDQEIVALKEAIKEYTEKALCSERLTALEAIHPYSDEEKADEKFSEFVKSLASISDDRMDNLALRRELLKAKSETDTSKSLSSVTNGGRISPAPLFENGVYKKPNIEDLL